jgi:hypothetical protein
MGVLERCDEFVEVGSDDGHRVGLLAVERTCRPIEFFIRRLVNSRSWVIRAAPVIGIDGHGIVVGGRREAGSGRRALMPSLQEHRADPDVDVVIEDEAH